MDLDVDAPTALKLSRGQMFDLKDKPKAASKVEGDDESPPVPDAKVAFLDRLFTVSPVEDTSIPPPMSPSKSALQTQI